MAGYRDNFSFIYIQPHDTDPFLSASPIQEIFRLLFQYCFHNTVSLVLVLSHINPIPPKPLCIFPLSRERHMLHPSFDYPNIYYRIKIRKLHIMQFLYLLLSSLSGLIFSWPPSAYVLRVTWETKIHTHITRCKIIFHCTLVFMFLDTGRGENILGNICWLQWADTCANYSTSVKRRIRNREKVRFRTESNCSVVDVGN